MGRRRDEAADAVRQIGTNALPWLLTWTRAGYAPWEVKVRSIAHKLPSTVQDIPVVRRALFEKDVEIGARGYAGFKILGGEARPAIPQLVSRMTDTNKQMRQTAMLSLRCIGREGIPSLVEALANTNQPGRADVAFYIGWVDWITDTGTNLGLAVPALIQSLKDKDAEVAEQAAMALGRLGLDADLVIPKLAEGLQDERPLIRETAAMALREYKDRGRSAVPALIIALADSHSDVREAVTNALRNIAPEVLAKQPE
jgi:HEAT repeat protein